MALQFVITNAGRAAMLDPGTGGTRAVRIAAVGVSATAVAPDPAAVALPGEVKRITTIAGDAVSPDVLHLIVRDETDAAYTVRSFALYLADGTLFGIYGQAAVILEKSVGAVMLLAVDLTLANVPAAQITFGATNFLNPPATIDRPGVVELATNAEAEAGIDATRALTPANVATILSAAKILQKLLTVDGAGSGLDADLLDGLDATAFLRRGFGGRPLDHDMSIGRVTIRGDNGGWETGYHFTGVNGSPLGGYGALGSADTLSYLYMGPSLTANNALRVYLDRVSWGANTIMHLGNDGAGSGFDADLLDGQDGSYYTNVVARLGYTPLNATSYTAVDLLAKLVTVDGAGSGLDADLLDGLDSTAFIRRLNGGRPLDFDNSSGAVTIRGDTGGWATGYLFRGAGNTILGGFGASGTASALSYLYAGPSYDAGNTLRVYADRVSWGVNTIMHLGNDGAGSGFDADLLDGQDGSWYANIAARLGYTPLNVASYTAADVLAKLMTVDGAGSGLDADLLDGQDGSWYTNIAARLGYTPLNATGYTAADVLAKLVTVDGAGSGLDADLLDGQDGSWYTNIAARLGYTPLNAAGYTAADVLAKLLTVDGAGSGLDADRLDGYDSTAFVRAIGSRPLDYDAEGGAMSIRGDPGGWATGYLFRGSSGAGLGGFGAIGFGSGLAYLYVGPSFDAANTLRIYGDRPAWGTSTIMHLGNDGAGSGFDADLLDGRHGSEFVLQSDPATFGSNANGYWEKRANGVIEQWGTVGGRTSEGSVYVVFPIPFTDLDSVNIQAIGVNAGSNNRYDMSVQEASRSIYDCSLYLQYSANQNSASVLDAVRWRAIGR